MDSADVLAAGLLVGTARNVWRSSRRAFTSNAAATKAPTARIPATSAYVTGPSAEWLVVCTGVVGGVYVPGAAVTVRLIEEVFDTPTASVTITLKVYWPAAPAVQVTVGVDVPEQVENSPLYE